jgi:hypothetical protein
MHGARHADEPGAPPDAPTAARRSALAVRLPAEESRIGATVSLDKHLYIIWNIPCIPGWGLV